MITFRAFSSLRTRLNVVTCIIRTVYNVLGNDFEKAWINFVWCNIFDHPNQNRCIQSFFFHSIEHIQQHFSPITWCSSMKSIINSNFCLNIRTMMSWRSENDYPGYRCSLISFYAGFHIDGMNKSGRQCAQI